LKGRAGVTIVGTGRLARALLHALAEAGERPLAVLSRRRERARRLARRIPGVEASPGIDEAAARARVVFLATPDATLAAGARALAAASTEWRDAVVLHGAGSLGVDVLRPLEKAGASTGVLHPYQALGEPEEGAALLRGARARIEGSARAIREARHIADRLGLVPFRFRRGSPDLAAYHASASLVSNDLLSLLCLAERVLVASGARRREARPALLAIARSTVAQFAARGARAATGPVVRGDASTVARQIAALGSFDPRAAAVHALLGEWLLDHAAALADGSAGRVRRALRHGLGTRAKV
jgi:predicted short-subunit dehydrogenase-like oxidoreductase (DUF2520 family)